MPNGARIEPRLETEAVSGPDSGGCEVVGKGWVLGGWESSGFRSDGDRNFFLKIFFGNFFVKKFVSIQQSEKIFKISFWFQ
jgi:hypothetical protein